MADAQERGLVARNVGAEVDAGTAPMHAQQASRPLWTV